MINEIEWKKRREQEEEKYVYVEHTAHIFLLSRKKSIGGDYVACDFATYLISGLLCRTSMNETRLSSQELEGNSLERLSNECHIGGNLPETYLHHQADNKYHRHTADDISVVLNDELMAQDRWVLLILFIAERLRSE